MQLDPSEDRFLLVYSHLLVLMVKESTTSIDAPSRKPGGRRWCQAHICLKKLNHCEKDFTAAHAAGHCLQEY